MYKIIEFLLLIKLLKYHLIEKKKTAMQDYQSLHIGLFSTKYHLGLGINHLNKEQTSIVYILSRVNV